MHRCKSGSRGEGAFVPGVGLAERSDVENGHQIDGVRLKAIREAAGMQQGRLAALLGISQANLSRLEAGRGKPRAATLMALAQIFDLPERDFSPVGRALESVMEDVQARQQPQPDGRGGNRPVRQVGQPIHEAMPLVREWTALGGPAQQFGWHGGFEHVLAHLVDGVAAPAVVKMPDESLAPDIREGHLVLFDTAATWQHGHLHVMEVDGVAALRWVDVRANVLRWHEPDGGERVSTTSRTRLFGVVVGAQPPAYRVAPRS